MLLKPLSDVKVVEADRLNLNLALLVGCQILSAVLLEPELVQRGLVSPVELLKEKFLQVWVNFCLISDHFTGTLQFFLFLEELYKC